MLLERKTFTDNSTIGELSIDGEFACFVLEDTCRTVKVAGQTAIPSGQYKVVRTHSPRFGRVLPLLLDVPHYAGIRIHPGNTSGDTAGCLLPGMRKDVDVVYDSKKAFEIVDKAIQNAEGDVSLTIIGGRPA